VKKVFKYLIRFRIFSIIYRTLIMINYFYPRLLLGIRWTFKRTEFSNFYYELTEKNKLELANFVSIVTGVNLETILSYIKELDSNFELRDHLRKSIGEDRFMSDSSLEFGRRVGWYAFARAIKPKLIIETGVHQGLGALVLMSALEKNEFEGFAGKYIGTDIDPEAGSLITEKYKKFGRVVIGDSLQSLSQISGPIDLFINDSDHSADYEFAEYKSIEHKLSPNSLILGDNCHSTHSLLEFSKTSKRSFLIFREQPKNHWYPGAGIGISFNSKSAH